MALRCPFCHDQTFAVRIQSTTDREEEPLTGWTVECDGCRASGPILPSETDAEAAWDAVARDVDRGRQADSAKAARAHARRLLGFNLPDIVTPQDAAGWLGISDRAVRAAMAEGRIPARHVANRWLTTRDRLVDWADQREGEEV